MDALEMGSLKFGKWPAKQRVTSKYTRVQREKVVKKCTYVNDYSSVVTYPRWYPLKYSTSEWPP